MARTYNVLTRFNAKDNVSAVTRRMQTGVNRFGNALKKKGSTLNKGLASANKNILRFATVGLAGATLFAGLATREFISLENSVINAGAKFKDLDVTSVNYNDSLKELTKSARDVGAVTEYTATDAAGALDKFAMAGLSSKTSMSLLMGTTNLATNSGLDLTTAVDIATDSLGAFGITAKMTGDSVKDAIIAEQGLNRISDVFSKTTTLSNTSLTELFETAKKAAPIFTSTGQSMETFGALTGVLANSGLKAEASGVNLRNIMLSLAKATPEAQKELERLHVQVSDSHGNFRDIVDILGDFETGLNGMGNAQRANALSTIFGKRSVAGLNILLQEGTGKINTFRDSLLDASGASKIMADSIRKSLDNQIKVLNSSLIEFGLKIVDAFAGDGKKGLEGLIEKVQNLDPKPFIEFTKVAVKTISWLATQWKSLVILAATIKTVSLAMGILTIASQLFGFALLATPVGWIIGAIALLTMGITSLALNWDIVTESVTKFGSYLKNTLLDLIDNALDKLQKMFELGSKIPIFGANMARRAETIQKIRNTIPKSDGYYDVPMSTEDAMSNMKRAFDIDNNRNSRANSEEIDYSSRYSVDVNFKNAPEGTKISNEKGKGNTNFNFTPQLSF